MRIAIHINNQNISEVDCRDLTKGNPGVGGTEYCFLLLAQLYKLYYPQNEIYLIANKIGKLPTVDKIIIGKDIFEAADIAAKENTDVLLISAVYKDQPLPSSFFERITSLKQRTIIWGHNFYLSDFCNQLCQCEYIKGNVFVGRQQYDRYIDHKVIRKSTYIYNMYPEYHGPYRNNMKNHTVTYVGSLVPTKGFHVLANAWKQILDKVPDAELNVIGSGKLYGRDSKLGKYGIAEEAYENLFMQGLIDDQGKILPSVHFWGVLGAEKSEVILDTAVGVVNPTGRTETFGISALDFESVGVPVVTIAKGGFLDTVIDHKTGILYSNSSDILGAVAELLKDKQKNVAYGTNGIEFSKEFAPEKIIGQWDELFKRVVEGKKLDFHMPNSFMKNNLKSYRLLNRKIKDALHFEYAISVIDIETIARKMLRMFGK